jgi:hypothetical protein
MMMNSPAKSMLSQLELDQNENFSAAQIEKFKNDPEFYKEFVKTIELDLNGAFALVSTVRFSWSVQGLGN